MRLDKWLWSARFYKTRRLAVDEIKKGRVKVNGEVAKPARIVAIGDEIAVNKSSTLFVVEVRALIEMRGPAKIAQTMYEERAESRARREREQELRSLSRVVPPKNPDSREKRQLRNLRQGRYLKEE